MRKTEVRTINGHCHVLKNNVFSGIIRENKESRYAFVIYTCRILQSTLGGIQRCLLQCGHRIDSHNGGDKGWCKLI